jgi:hypothetical protein
LSSSVPTIATTPANAPYCKTPTVAATTLSARTVTTAKAEVTGTDPRPDYWQNLAKLQVDDPTGSSVIPLPAPSANSLPEISLK